jgi:hypothetical protein
MNEDFSLGMQGGELPILSTGSNLRTQLHPLWFSDYRFRSGKKEKMLAVFDSASLPPKHGVSLSGR